MDFTPWQLQTNLRFRYTVVKLNPSFSNGASRPQCCRGRERKSSKRQKDRYDSESYLQLQKCSRTLRSFSLLCLLWPQLLCPLRFAMIKFYHSIPEFTVFPQLWASNARPHESAPSWWCIDCASRTFRFCAAAQNRNKGMTWFPLLHYPSQLSWLDFGVLSHVIRELSTGSAVLS
jgi:hypothetical protein